MTIDTMIHSVTLSWDDGDITWLSAPSGSDMTTAYSTNIYNGDADWELCYIVALPTLSDFETTRNTYTDSYSDTACGVVQSGEFRRLQYQVFIPLSTTVYLTIHRNITSSEYKLSIYTSFQVGSPMVKPIDDLYGWDLFFDGTPVTTLSQWGVVGTYYAPIYSGWKNFTITSCADIYDTFAIAANSPARFTEPHPVTLDTTLSVTVCSGGTTAVRFTDVGWVRVGSGPRIGRIQLAYTDIAAADIEISFAECPP
jgi:hypothetical protein